MLLVLLYAAHAVAAPAPTRAPLGLQLGGATDADVAAWMDARGIEGCAQVASPRRTTVRWECGAQPASVLPERQVGAGTVDAVVLARLDDGPVHHLSTAREHAAVDEARVDYESSVSRLTALLGSPTSRVAAPSDAAFTRPVAHASTRWTFDDLVVELTVVKAAGRAVTVSERWDVPGVSARATARD